MASMDAAGSTGEQFRRFWRWWVGELRECVPTGIVQWLGRLRVAPLVMPEDGGFAVYRFDGARWQRVAKAAGETPEALANALGAELRKARIERFAVGLLPGQFLARTISLPQAAEENLRYALHYELDRHTPFKPDDVGFDCCVVGRDEKNREIAVNLVIAPKATISQALAGVAGAGMRVTAVRAGFPEGASLPINLLPHDENGNGHVLRLKRWLPWVLMALLGLTALVLPIYQKRAQIIELQPQVNVATQQAQAADLLHQQLDRAQAEYNYVLQKRYATPTSLQLLAEVTRILPDDTWLQSFELRTMSKSREVQLQGETGVAGKMIELFEQSPLLTGASFKSPVTQAPGSQASRFHLGMEVKETPPPATLALAQVGDTIPAAVPGGPAVPLASAPPAAATAPGALEPARVAAPAPANALPLQAPTPPPVPAVVFGVPATPLATAPAPGAPELPHVPSGAKGGKAPNK
jgi:general secretion pathway protein L